MQKTDQRKDAALKGLHCQSCDMPLLKDPEGGGREADGTRSQKYCSLCFDLGAFRWVGEDVKEFQAMVVDQMSKDGWNRMIAWLLTRRIPKLERWKAP